MILFLFTLACNQPESTEVPALDIQAQKESNTERSQTAKKKVPQKPVESTSTLTTPFISEVMIMPTKVEKFRGEWIELYNPTEAPIDLSEYSFHSKDDTGLTFENGSTIEPQSTFLLAVRKSHTGNGGLPKVDHVYNHNVLKVLGTDWLELKKGETIVDRWEFTRTDFKKGTALQRDDEGHMCFSNTPYGDGDIGSPGSFISCH